MRTLRPRGGVELGILLRRDHLRGNRKTVQNILRLEIGRVAAAPAVLATLAAPDAPVRRFLYSQVDGRKFY
jgi:hypothetical protein